MAPGSTVTLSGSGSDPDKWPNALTYEWTAPAGVTLSNATTATPTFAVSSAAGTVYTFTLKVSDGALSGTDDVVITVAPIGVLAVADGASTASWTADFGPVHAGRSVSFQKQTIATTMPFVINAVPTAAWVEIGRATADADGTATFTVTNPLEVTHHYRAVVDQGAGTETYTNIVAHAPPRTTVDSGLATIYVDTDEGEDIASREDSWQGTFAMDGPAGSRCATVAPVIMKIAGRGNSSWDLPKKPYKFALDKALDLCGMGSSKKWNLIANYEDGTLLRNSLAMTMGTMLTGLEWSPKSTPVDLYVNGDYQGSYTLMDRVTAASNRIDIDQLRDNATGLNDVAPNVTGGYLLEWDNRRTSDHNVCVGGSAVVGKAIDGTCSGSGWVGIKEPEDEPDGTGITAAEISYLDQYLESADQEIGRGNWKPYIDAASAVDYIIAMEVTKNYGANMRSSVFMYKKRDADPATPGDQGKLYFGPLWDFDTSFGNFDYGGPEELIPTGWWVSEPNPTIKAVQGTPTWFHHLMDDPEFAQLVKDRWNTLKTAGFKATADAFIASEREFVAKSVAADKVRWGGDDDGAVSQLQSWFTTRYAWLDGRWGNR